MGFIDAGGVTRIPTNEPSAADPPVSGDDAYPRVAQDQRDIYGVPFVTADEVWVWWAEWLARDNRPLTHDGRHAQPRVEYVPAENISRWVAICPDCQRGMACWDRNPYTACLDCGTMFEVDWLPPHVRAAGLRLLAERPVAYRIWLEDETVADLEAQNRTLARLLGPTPRLVIPDEIATTGELLDMIGR